jgi:hypothetical protein
MAKILSATQITPQKLLPVHGRFTEKQQLATNLYSVTPAQPKTVEKSRQSPTGLLAQSKRQIFMTRNSKYFNLSPVLP